MKMMVTDDSNGLSKLNACTRLFIALTMNSISHDKGKGCIYGITWRTFMKVTVTYDYDMLSNLVTCTFLFIGMTLGSISNNKTKGCIHDLS